MGQIMIRGVDKESSIRGRNKTLRSPEVENEACAAEEMTGCGLPFMYLVQTGE
jgi:hypothetical protein